MKKKYIIYVVTLLFIIISGTVGYMKMNNNSTNQNEEIVTTVNVDDITSIDVDQLVAVKSSDVDLLKVKDKPKKKENLYSTIIDDDSEKIKKISNEGMHVFFVNNGNNSLKILKTINTYIDNINANSIKNLKFYTIKHKKKNNCLDNIKITPKNKFSVFDKLDDDIKIINLLDMINKVSENNNSFFIINGSNLGYNCNNIEELKSYIKDNNGKKFTNVIIIKNSKQNDQIISNFYNELENYTGIKTYNDLDSFEFQKILESRIYSFDKSERTFGDTDEDINTKIYFYDQDEESYSGNLTIMKKDSNKFIPVQKLEVSDHYYGALNPGIYYFTAYDPINKIYLETEPITINNNNPFNHSFIFRTTKIEMYLLDNDDKPIIGDFYVDFVSPNERYQKTYDNTSKVLFYGKPGKYKVHVKVKGEVTTFNSDFSISGEKYFEKKFKTKKIPIEIKVYSDQDENIKKNSTVLVTKNGKNIFNGTGGIVKGIVNMGDYKVTVKDTGSGATITKDIKVEDGNGTQTISVIFELHDATLDMGLKPIIVELYNINEPHKKIKTFSGTGLKRVKLPEGEYMATIYDIEKNNPKNMNFSISSFYDNYITFE